MDPLDAFYQELDSERLLKEHGPGLLADAREVLAANPHVRVAGLITLPAAKEAEQVRKALAAVSGHPVPAGKLMVGIVPRGAVEGALTDMCSNVPWREEAWQPQQVLPIVVSTRVGFGFPSLRMGNCHEGASGHA